MHTNLKYIYSFFAILILFNSCYPTSIGFKDGSMDPALKFFAVENFEQIAANVPMNYPVQFTEFLKDGMVRNTKLKLLPTSSNETHLIFSGEINRYELTPVSVQSDNQAAQTRLTVGMKVYIENKVDAEKSMEFSISRFEDFNNDTDFNSVETRLLENINEQLLQDILNKLQSDW